MAGLWVSTGVMFDARWGHTATRLRDGRVLVAGGWALDTSASRRSAEIYDAQTAQWTRTGSMHDSRALHTATLLQDGQVLVAGGYALEGVIGGRGLSAPYSEIPVLATAELFSPATGTWQRVPDMNTSHAEHTATLLPDGRVFVADGNGGFGDGPAVSLDAVEWFDPVTESWRLTNRGQPRYGATSTLLANGFVLMLGGSNYDGYQEKPAFVANLYDPVNDTLGNSVDLNNPRAWHTATLLPDGTVLLAGGGTRTSASPITGPFQVANTPIEERYDPVTAQLHQTASMQQRRHRHTATLLQDGTVLVAGGNYYTSPTGSNTAVESLASSERYQLLASSPPSDGSWTTVGNLTEARSGHTATLLNDGTVLVAGGVRFPGEEVLYTAERFFPNIVGCRQTFARVSVTMALLLNEMLVRLLRRSRQFQR